MSFHWPYLLLALPLVLAGLLVLFASAQRARERLLSQFAAARLLPMLLSSYSAPLRRIKNILMIIGVLLVVLALARPQWGYDWQEQHAHGVDVIFVIDTSRSMLSQDVLPNRLERAKLAIMDCVEKMAGNRVGLVAFAGDAFLQCPLTLDYDAFRETIETIDTKTISRGGTDIGAGLEEAAAALENSGNHKTIVLLTDGEDLEGQGVAEAKTLADQGITVYTVGVGTPEGELIPIRSENGGTDFVKDASGQIVKSHLDSSTLSSIAQATHGFYEPLGATGEGLAKVYEEGIKKLPQQNLVSQVKREPIERFQWPLTAAFVLLALEMLLGNRRPSWLPRPDSNLNLDPIPVSAATEKPKSKTPPASRVATPPVIAGILLIALGLSLAQSSRAAESPTPAPSAPATTDLTAATPTPADSTSPTAKANLPQTVPSVNYSPQAAQNLFQNGDYPSAATAYGQASDAVPNDGRFSYNQGDSLYRNKDYEAAAQAFTKTLSSNDLTLQQRAYYNLGNSNYRLGQSQMKDDPKKAQTTWETTAKDYQNALELNPKDADASYNLKVVQAQLEELKKQQEQQKQDQQKDQSQDQQNQQSQDQNQQNQNQNQQNQNNSQQNQSGQQNQQSQNNSSSQNQSDSGQQQNQPQNPGDKNQQSGDQKQANQTGNQNQKPDQGTGDKPGQQKQASNQKSNDQSQKGNQGQQPQPGDSQMKEPNQQKAGQNPAQAAANGTGGQPASAAAGDKGDGTENGQVIAGMMTREEASQLLDSLKTNEHKLPVVNVQKTDQKASSDQPIKDW